MYKRLPKKLLQEPIVDAVCEIRVTTNVDLHTVLPGVLFTQLSSRVERIEQLPANAIPEQLRLGQPELALAPMMKIHLGGYFVLVGARNVLVSPRLPYRGWEDYRRQILEVFRLLLKQSFVKGVERYSIKYMNLIERAELRDQFSLLDWDIRIGSHRLDSHATAVRVEVHSDRFVTILQLATGITAEIVEPRATKQGCLVDVDTVCQSHMEDLASFGDSLEGNLNDLRRQNKAMFFDCLRDETIASLGPIYD